MLTLLLSTLSGVTLSYYDKKGVVSGISKIQFIFLKMLALIPFAFVLFFLYPFKFEITLISILLIVGLLIINLTNYLGFIGVVKKTSPYETGVLLSLTIPIVYIVDVLIGSETLSVFSLLFLFIVITGVVILSLNEINVKEFKGSFILSILSAVSKGYIIYFLLNYMSIPVYILILHIATAVLIYFFFNKKLQIKSLTKSDFKWAFTTQFIGVFSLVFNAILAKTSVSLYILRTPFKLTVSVISSYFVKNKNYVEKPSTKKLIGSTLTVVGLCLFLLY